MAGRTNSEKFLGKSKPDKYAMYEASVQSPERDMDWFASVYKDLRKREARVLREDFCGTFLLAKTWVQKNKNNRAIGLDLDSIPIEYGMKNHAKSMTVEEKSRLRILQKNVMSVTSPKADLIIANNFSFFVFKTRKELVRYFTFARKSLAKDGVFIIELAGGPGMIQKLKETKTVRVSKNFKCTYIWDQKSYNPVTHEGLYSIHFKLSPRRMMKDAFVYDWRVWTLAEVREAMIDAGFKDTAAYWETSIRGAATGEYIRTDKGENDWSWIAYAVGIK